MSEIDVQNAKQIRDPMDVLITMEVPDESITLTYSGYSSAKVADGVLGQSAWPMRLLADLQGEGFPLDGSRVLYDSSTSASEANGKIGVRSNTGQTVSVTVTGNEIITNLSIYATGAESVTYNGTTSAIVGGVVVIPVQARTVTLTFNPASETQRIEVSSIIAGTVLAITNDNLVKCVVSLRSDLSIIDPSLPESEINIEAYNDADISETVANLPEGTPIKYQAGYPGDMSPVRQFYVSGQVTWKDNVLSIPAVDAVRFLDRELPTSILSGGSTRDVALITKYLLDNANIRYDEDISTAYQVPTGASIILSKGARPRDVIAGFTWAIRTAATKYWYVDAGIPSLYIKNAPTSGGYIIDESDCGDIEKNTDVSMSKTTINYNTVGVSDSAIVGSVDWKKNGPAYLNIDEYTSEFIIASDVTYGRTLLPTLKPSGTGSNRVLIPTGGNTRLLNKLYSDNVFESDMIGQNSRGETIYPYCQVIPWSSMASASWDWMVDNGSIDADETGVTLDIGGYKRELIRTTAEYSAGDSGRHGVIEWDAFSGEIYFNSSIRLFPDDAIKKACETSPITYAFTWKGDPRMQPRDVVEWQRLDGTTETITLENITITHENGGTVAEITARKGIV